MRWETQVFETNGMAEHTGGMIVADGKSSPTGHAHFRRDVLLPPMTR